MKIAIDKGKVICADCGAYFQQIRATGRFKWNKSNKTMVGDFGLLTLNALADCCKLPQHIAAERTKLQRIDAAVREQKQEKSPTPLVKYPVSATLMAHQIAAANMAMMIFGVVEPPEEREVSNV